MAHSSWFTYRFTPAIPRVLLLQTYMTVYALQIHLQVTLRHAFVALLLHVRSHQVQYRALPQHAQPSSKTYPSGICPAQWQLSNRPDTCTTSCCPT